MSEQWSTHPDFPTYHISDHGRVKNHRSQVIKTRKNQCGTLTVSLYHNQKYHCRSLARLVWEAFNGPLPDNSHIVRSRIDDSVRLDDLYVTTDKDWVDGQSLLKLTDDDVRRIFELRCEEYTYQDIADMIGISAPTVRTVLMRIVYPDVNIPDTLVRRAQAIKHGIYKLSIDDVATIRALYEDGHHLLRDLAAMYDIDISTVSRVVNGHIHD